METAARTERTRRHDYRPALLAALWSFVEDAVFSISWKACDFAPLALVAGLLVTVLACLALSLFVLAGVAMSLLGG